MSHTSNGSKLQTQKNQDQFWLEEESSADALSKLIEGSDELFIKKMSLNDWEWAIKKNKHQNGPLIPKQQREGNFFPPRAQLATSIGSAAIYLAEFPIVWPQTGEVIKASFRHYQSKDEAHLTGMPKSLFINLAPASFIVIGKNNKEKNLDFRYRALIIDSTSEEANALVDLFQLSPTFSCGTFLPASAIRSFEDRVLDFIEQALSAFRSGVLSSFSEVFAKLPEPHKIAVMAQTKFLESRNISNLNPFVLDAPGDCLMEISRGIELEIFREYELRQRSIELIRTIIGDDPSDICIDDVFRNLIRHFPRIDKILLSASQTRKARAGRSFEYHIETMLKDAQIPHEVQMIMTSKRRPDFILPSFELYKRRGRPHDQALVLSAKTTLRERWKQVEGEIKDCDLYLATVDDKIAENAISSMQEAGIKLVVPESLKKSKVTTYEHQANVISFKEFFETDIKKLRFPSWSSLGLLKSEDV